MIGKGHLAFRSSGANARGLGTFASTPEDLGLLELQEGLQLRNQPEFFVDRRELAQGGSDGERSRAEPSHRRQFGDGFKMAFIHGLRLRSEWVDGHRAVLLGMMLEEILG
jgi:hypothetical protein